MGHATHFLQRLDRVNELQVELALTLYRDGELLKAVLSCVTLPEAADSRGLRYAMPTVELHRRTRLKWWLVGIVYTAIAVLLGIDAYNIPPMHPSQHVSPLLWVFLVVPLAVPVLAMWHRTASHYVLLRVLAIPCLLVSGILFVAYAMAWDDFAMPTPIWTIAGFFLSVVEILVVFAQLCMRGLWRLMKAG